MEYSVALTRKMLKAMGIEDEKIDQIIEEHVESTDGLKAERDRYKAKADEAECLAAELQKLKKAGEGAGEYEEKYKAKCKELDDFKAQVDGEKAAREKRGLYRDLLEKAGVDPKRIKSVLKVSDLDAVTVKDGAIEGADELTEKIRADWADFIPVTTTQGANVPNPPKATGGEAVTVEQFRKMGIRQRQELHDTDPAAYKALNEQSRAKEQ